jgi:hypothetical protein
MPLYFYSFITYSETTEIYESEIYWTYLFTLIYLSLFYDIIQYVLITLNKRHFLEDLTSIANRDVILVLRQVPARGQIHSVGVRIYSGIL